ncbi:MAG TPA: DEAD/DEAH box helicase [Mycobacteriales bacterium]|nr:DEAD/DEAH box helicase [Mycobacteriales bacterium]
MRQTLFTAFCTCPVGDGCKHAAALLVAARDGRRRGAVTASAPDWERLLTPVVRPEAAQAATVPIALQFEVGERDESSPYTIGRTTTLPSRRVRLRPVVLGSTGRWVRTGVSWSQLRFEQGRSVHRADQTAALREFVLVRDASTRAGYGGYAGYSDALYLDELGPSLWRLLDQAVASGVPLVPAKPPAGGVVLSPTPATLALDLTRDTVGGGAVLRPRLALGDQALDARSVDYVGVPPHGVTLCADGGLVLARLDKPMDHRLYALIRDNQPLHIPQPDLDRFLGDYYPELQRTVTVTSTDGSVALPEIAPPRLGLTVTYGDGHRVGLEWAFEYRVGNVVHSHPLGAERPGAGRDVAAEWRLLQSVRLPSERLPRLWVKEPGGDRLTSPVILAGMDTVAFLDEVLPWLQAEPDVVVYEHGRRPELRRADNAPEVRIRATDATDDADWFDLHVTVWVDGQEVPFDALFTALARGESHLLLPSGTWFGLDRDELHELRRLIEEARNLLDTDAGQLRVSHYQAGLWQELQALGVVEEQSERWSRVVSALVDLDRVEPPAPPVTLKAALRPYQVDGYEWLSFLCDHRLGGILADDMGLGKTVQVLALLCRAKESGRLDAPALVVAPTSVVRNWASEAAQFAPDLRVAVVSETQARSGASIGSQAAAADVVVTSYALFRIDHEAYAAVPWSALVLDEAQFVKNHQAKTYQYARRLAAPFKLAVTGTPLENNLMELWALLSIVAPGLFPNPHRFSDFYRRPIERGSDPALLASLRRRIRPLMRRRTKEEVASDLPVKQEQVLEVDLSPKHRKIYDTYLQRERQKILGLVDDLDRNRFTILKSLTLLRQLSLDAGLVDDRHHAVRSSKLDALVEHLGALTAEGHRALVFSQFTGFLRRVRDRLDAEGIRYCYLDGRTRNRDKAIAGFKGGLAPVFLISLKAGGFGLNLTEADYCFILDPWWNPATEAQAVDRAHRIGQDKKVVVYRFVSADTVEEKVMALKARKAELFSGVMGDDGMLAAPLTADDIKALFEH